MERVCRGLHWKTLLLYLDDVIIIAPDFQTHVQRLQQVLQRLREAGLKLKPSKCALFQNQVKYLGHVVSEAGVATDPEKTAAIAQWPAPTSLTELQAFLGTVGYYRQYLVDFATTAKPLTKLTSKGVPWEWDEATQAAFETLREQLLTAPILQYPDETQPFILDTDASNAGVGAVLSQEKEGQERVVAYFSKTFSPPERNYCVTRRELLAVIKAVKHFKPYLYGRKFRLRTDHASLIWLCKRTEPSCQVARWLEVLSEFDYSIEHRAGTKHGNADGLSRRPHLDCKQCFNIEKRDGGPTMEEVMNQLDSQPCPGPSSTQKSPPCTVETQPQHQMKVVKDLPSPMASRSQPNPVEQVQPVFTRQKQSTRDLLEMQAEIPGTIAEIYQVVKNQTEMTREQVQMRSREFQTLYNQRDAMTLSGEGILEIALSINHRTKKVLVCPQAMRHKIVWDTHRLAHAGIMKTLARIRLDWYWPGMTTEIRRLLRTCEICQAAKHSNAPTTTGKRRLFAGRPWQILAVDLVGPMPRTPRGNAWILVLTDHFSRWQDAIPLPDATAPVVARTLDDRVFSYFGLPEVIHTDQGAQFESDLMQSLCRLWKVTKTRTTSYHPQGNSVVERHNKTLGDSLRTLLMGSDQEEWDLLLPQIMRAFRGTPHTTTGETANYVMLGREVRLPDQLILPTQPPEQPNQYVLDLHERLAAAHQAIRDKQMQVRSEDSEEPPLFSPGDWVWMQSKRKRKGQCTKLQVKFVGPYQVKEAFRNHTYKLTRDGQETIQNEGRLKAYIPSQGPEGQAPVMLEPARRPNMRGATRKKKRQPEIDLDIAIEPLPINMHNLPILPTLEEMAEASQDADPIIGDLPLIDLDAVPTEPDATEIPGKIGTNNSPTVHQQSIMMGQRPKLLTHVPSVTSEGQVT